MHGEDELVGRERLHLELAEPRAVEGVCDVRADDIEIEEVRAGAHLLVDGEDDAHRRSGSGVVHEVGNRGHDLGNPGLVVRAEQRRAVARHEIVTDA